jgi:hypothetical protein
MTAAYDRRRAAAKPRGFMKITAILNSGIPDVIRLSLTV